MSIKKQFICKHHGKNVYSFILDNNAGLSAEIFNYGGIIKKLVYKGVDVCLGFDDFEDYLNNTEYFGAIIGRNANRIENAQFTLNNKTYKLSNNFGCDNHHGGYEGFNNKVWKAKICDNAEPELCLSLTSPDGDEGFPGNVDVKVTYTLTQSNSLKIEYYAVCDADTVLNLTNHTYFNLNGHNSGNISNHKLWLNSDYYTPNSDLGLPNGEIKSVKGTPFDFTLLGMTKINLASDFEQIKKFGGYDHNFVLNGFGFKKAGEVKADKTGITMQIYTDTCGMQIYTANEIEGNIFGKEKAVYAKHSGVCFETQCFPNNLNIAHFPKGIIKKGEKHYSITEYKFI